MSKKSKEKENQTAKILFLIAVLSLLEKIVDLVLKFL